MIEYKIISISLIPFFFHFVFKYSLISIIGLFIALIFFYLRILPNSFFSFNEFIIIDITRFSLVMLSV